MRRAWNRAAMLLLVLFATPSLAADTPAPAGCSLDAARSGKPLPFGCANALNLQAMVEDPADLAAGRALPLPVGDNVVRAIGRSRDGVAVPLPNSSSTETPGASGAN